jgi:D-glycero-D-manno-heptose 1,7-bisphosphate phosphatase
MTVSRPAIFLDRDGVINELVSRDGGRYSPRRFEDFKLFPWTLEALDIFKSEGFLLVIITNQPDISRGKMKLKTLEAMHAELRRLTPIDAIYVCTHDSDEGCECRKPMPGMLLHAAEDLNISLVDSWTIGDRESDILAGRAAGTKVMYVASGERHSTERVDILSTCDLRLAARIIVQHSKSG